MVYLDDTVLASPDSILVKDTQNLLQIQFKLKLLGGLKNFLGLEITYSSKGIHLCQRKYKLQLLIDIGFINAKPFSLLMDANASFNDEEWPLLEDVSQYRRIIGRLLYLTLYRPAISYVVNKLSQYMSKPRKQHINMINQIMQYLKGIPG